MTSGPVVLDPSPSLLTTHKSRDCKGPRLNHRLPRHITRKGLSTPATSEEGQQDIITARKTKRKGDQVHCPPLGIPTVPSSILSLRAQASWIPPSLRHWSDSSLARGLRSFPAVPNLLAPGTGFEKDYFSKDWGRRWFQDDSMMLHLLCTLFLLLLHQLHSRSFGIRSWRFMTLRQLID